jgi:glycosyltransferase involved in cell wall biosynthesis
MFPNSINPHIGVFVKERLKHVSQKTDLTMVAPVQSFPFSDHTAKYAGLSKLQDKEVIDGMTVHHPRYFMIPKYFKILDAMFYGRSLESYMEKMASRENFDIFDFHWVFPDAIGGLLWARKLGKKTVVTVRGNEAIYYFERNRIRKVVQKRLAEFDHVIAVSNDLKSKIVSEFGVHSSRISVIPNGVDTEKFSRMDKCEARRRCGLAEGNRYLLTVSRLSNEKGLENLLRAFGGIRCTDSTLVIIGDGPLEAKLIALSTELGIRKRVKFMGVLGHADICAWYNAADLFCLPSLWEGCPNVVIEALACGTPVVASQVGGIPDLVPSPDYGSLVPPGDVAALTVALEKALDKDWNRQGISQFGSANSWGDVADKVISVFEEVLS